jgi:hypothetical protein
MRQKHTLWRAAALLCGAALLVLPMGASYAQSKKDQKQQTRSKVSLTQQQRDVVRASIKKSKPTTTGSAGALEKDVTIGERLPNNVVVERFSDTVYRSVPPVRSYHYIARDRGIYLVDPRRRVVVDLIE